MSYCSASDVKTIKSIQPLLEPNGNWSDSDINSKIEEISNTVIDTRLRSRYVMPISPIPDELQRICKLKTAYEMLQEEFGNTNSKWDYLNTEAEYLLNRIEQGELLLTDEDTEQPDFRGPSLTFRNNNNDHYFHMEG